MNKDLLIKYSGFCKLHFLLWSTWIKWKIFL